MANLKQGIEALKRESARPAGTMGAIQPKTHQLKRPGVGTASDLNLKAANRAANKAVGRNTRSRIKNKEYEVEGTNTPKIDDAIAQDIKWKRVTEQADKESKRVQQKEDKKTWKGGK